MNRFHAIGCALMVVALGLHGETLYELPREDLEKRRSELKKKV